MLEIKSQHLTWVGPKSLGYKKNIVVNGRKIFSELSDA